MHRTMSLKLGKPLSISLLGDTLRLRGAHVVLFRADANCCSKNCPLPTFHSFRPLSALHGLTCPCCVESRCDAARYGPSLTSSTTCQPTQRRALQSTSCLSKVRKSTCCVQRTT